MTIAPARPVSGGAGLECPPYLPPPGAAAREPRARAPRGRPDPGRREEAQCREFPPGVRVLCPLLGRVAATEDVDGGVRVRLADGVDVGAAIDQLRFQLAFGRTRGGMGACPLSVRGVRVEPATDSRSVELTVPDADDVEDLRKRARSHLGPRGPRSQPGQRLEE